MKKVTFYKMIRDPRENYATPQASTGYKQTYNYYDPSGRDAFEISLIFEKRAFDWAITEEKTGFLVRGNFRTRKEAEKSVTPELLKAINEKLPGLNYYITLVNIERGKREAARCF